MRRGHCIPPHDAVIKIKYKENISGLCEVCVFWTAVELLV